MSNFTKRKLAIAVALSLAVNINSVQAEDDKYEDIETKGLEVISVTSQKRVESIQEAKTQFARNYFTFHQIL